MKSTCIFDQVLTFALVPMTSSCVMDRITTSNNNNGKHVFEVGRAENFPEEKANLTVSSYVIGSETLRSVCWLV